MVGAGAGAAGVADVVPTEADPDVAAWAFVTAERVAGVRLVPEATRVGVPARARCPAIATVAIALAAAAAMRERRAG